MPLSWSISNFFMVLFIFIMILIYSTSFMSFLKFTFEPKIIFYSWCW